MPQRPRAPVELPPELAGRLGLGEAATRVRPLAGGQHVLLLERIAPGSAVPWDRDLVLCADVRAFSLADVMGMLHGSRKSGFLHFEQGECAKSVYLHGGEVVFATSNQRVDRLGESLVRAGVIDLEQHRQASEAYAPPAQFGRFLVQRGVLSPRQLWDGVKAQVEDIVRSLFSFESGQVFLWEGEVRPDNVVRLALPTSRLIEEGMEQRDELLLFLAQLEDRRVRIEAVPGQGRLLDGTAAAIVGALGSVDTFPALCQAVGVDPLSGARTVRLLDQLGALRRVHAEAPADARGEDEALRACVRAHVKILAELAAPIVAMEGAEPLRVRLGEVAREAASRHPHLLDGLSLGPGGVLDPEPLIERALCFPGDREREVREALGGLVSYVEFELLNHPKVQDAESFLAALEGLRAEL